MKITNKTLNKDLPCKNSFIDKIDKEGPVVVCKLTKLSCCLYYSTRSIGNHIFEEELKRCPGVKLRKEKITNNRKRIK